MTQIQSTKQSGFTLIELSIVLVIIGLIVGGVLVGQDLIKAAQIRATVSQLERYDAAVNTFRGKYNGMPGDLANCGNFFTPTSPGRQCPTTGTQGNGIFEDFSTTYVKMTGEVAAFWTQLAAANMIGDSITVAGVADAANPIAADVKPGTTLNNFPAGKIGSGNFVYVYTGSTTLAYPGMAGVNLYRIAGLTFAGATGAPTLGNTLTPLEAFQIDTKKDDGIPNAGIVQGTDASSFNDTTAPSNDKAATPSGTVCLSAANAYNTSTTSGNTRLCQVLIRTSF